MIDTDEVEVKFQKRGTLDDVKKRRSLMSTTISTGNVNAATKPANRRLRSVFTKSKKLRYPPTAKEAAALPQLDKEELATNSRERESTHQDFDPQPHLYCNELGGKSTHQDFDSQAHLYCNELGGKSTHQESDPQAHLYSNELGGKSTHQDSDPQAEQCDETFCPQILPTINEEQIEGSTYRDSGEQTQLHVNARNRESTHQDNHYDYVRQLNGKETSDGYMEVPEM